MPSAVKLGRLAVADYPRMLELWKSAGLPVKLKGRDRRAHIAREMKERPDLFIGAWDRGLLVGTIIASHDGRKGWLNRIAVAPGYRGRGLAQALTAAGERVLRRHGIRIIGLLILADNAASLALAKKSGYQEHRDIVYFSKRDGAQV